MRVFRPQLRIARQVAAGELRIEIEIQPARRIVELDQREQPRLGPHVLQEQALAPAGIGKDDVGHETLRLQLQRGRGARFAADHLGLELLRPGMRLAARRAAGFVAMRLDPRQSRAVDHERLHQMTGAREVRSEVLELAGKVLVDEEQVHRARRFAGWRREPTP